MSRGEGESRRMAADAEVLIDRRRLRRKLTLWRVLGIGGLIVAAGAVGYRARAGTEVFGFSAAPSQIARISIGGFIAGMGLIFFFEKGSGTRVGTPSRR